MSLPCIVHSSGAPCILCRQSSRSLPAQTHPPMSAQLPQVTARTGPPSGLKIRPSSTRSPPQIKARVLFFAFIAADCLCCQHCCCCPWPLNAFAILLKKKDCDPVEKERLPLQCTASVSVMPGNRCLGWLHLLERHDNATFALFSLHG